jgi:UDP-N-acetylmuramoylalanine--D-glutamate ligase
MTARTVAVVGFGVTGQAVAKALGGRGERIVAFDDAPSEEARAAAAALGVALQPTPAGQALVAALAGCDLVVPSPGVPAAHPIYRAAREAGVPVRAEIEVAAVEAAAAGRPKLVAVTGTNGKTTVTTLVTAMLEASHQSAMAAGNIGRPMIEAVGADAAVVVAEVSSFQLQYTETFRPAVAAWLNFSPDHLDWHPSLSHYAEAKARIWANQSTGDVAVYNLDDDAVTKAASGIPAGVAQQTFSLQQPADYRLDGQRLVTPTGDLAHRGELPRDLPHDVANSLAAAAVALAAGATLDGCHQALVSTEPLPHRVQLVAEADGVRWFDDSKATTPASVLAAAAGFDRAVLIAGGRNKGLDLNGLASTVPPVHAVVAIGEAAVEVANAFAERVPVVVAHSMEEAVDAAAGLAESGDAVLLSPGCTSFDWYRSYAERGDHFAAIVTSRLNEGERKC